MGFKEWFSRELLCGINKRLQDVSAGKPKYQYFSWTLEAIKKYEGEHS